MPIFIQCNNNSFIIKFSQKTFPRTVFALGISAFIPATKSFAQSSTKLTDPEIASVAVVANHNDIGFAAVAKTKSTNKDVLQFAQTMATDHQSVIDQATALVTKSGVTPKDNAVSKKLRNYFAFFPSQKFNEKLFQQFIKKY